NVFAFPTTNACGFLSHISPFTDLYAAVIPAATPSEAVGISAVGSRETIAYCLPADCRQLLLLAGNSLSRTLAGTRVGVRTLTTNRQAAAMTQTTVATEVHQTLDVHGHFATQIAFDLIVAVDRLTDRENFGVGQLMNALVVRNVD